MNQKQERARLEEESRQAQQATKQLKKHMIIVIICMVVFAAIALPLINLLDNLNQKNDLADPKETSKIPGNFYLPDYDCNIMEDQEYLKRNRTVLYTDNLLGTTYALDKKNLTAFGPAIPVLNDMVNAIIEGDEKAYNSLFSDAYFDNHDPEAPFTMQRVYDIQFRKIEENTKKGGEGSSYIQYVFEVEYKIMKNDGTFRTDIASDEARKQYIILADRQGDEVLIDQIIFHYD